MAATLVPRCIVGVDGVWSGGDSLLMSPYRRTRTSLPDAQARPGLLTHPMPTAATQDEVQGDVEHGLAVVWADQWQLSLASCFSVPRRSLTKIRPADHRGAGVGAGENGRHNGMVEHAHHHQLDDSRLGECAPIRRQHKVLVVPVIVEKQHLQATRHATPVSCENTDPFAG